MDERLETPRGRIFPAATLENNNNNNNNINSSNSITDMFFYAKLLSETKNSLVDHSLEIFPSITDEKNDILKQNKAKVFKILFIFNF